MIYIQDLKPGDVLKKTEKVKHIEQLSITNEENIKPQTQIQIGSDQPYLSVSTLQQEIQSITILFTLYFIFIYYYYYTKYE